MHSYNPPTRHSSTATRTTTAVLASAIGDYVLTPRHIYKYVRPEKKSLPVDYGEDYTIHIIMSRKYNIYIYRWSTGGLLVRTRKWNNATAKAWGLGMEMNYNV